MGLNDRFKELEEPLTGSCVKLLVYKFDFAAAAALTLIKRSKCTLNKYKNLVQTKMSCSCFQKCIFLFLL